MLQRCALCGFEFDATEAACHHACPIASSCNLTRCPSCGYEFPSRPRSLDWFRRIFKKRAAVPVDGARVPLPDLAEGDVAELICLSEATAKRRNALAVYGVVPGCRLVLERKRPAVVIRVGETELALEESIARQLLVRRLAD